MHFFGRPKFFPSLALLIFWQQNDFRFVLIEWDSLLADASTSARRFMQPVNVWADHLAWLGACFCGYLLRCEHGHRNWGTHCVQLKLANSAVFEADRFVSLGRESFKQCEREVLTERPPLLVRPDNCWFVPVLRCLQFGIPPFSVLWGFRPYANDKDLVIMYCHERLLSIGPAAQCLAHLIGRCIRDPNPAMTSDYDGAFVCAVELFILVQCPPSTS